ncbi:MAG: VWA domain-containing protein [Phycisphaerales bacterium]|nr:VWA domain-containing protein [Phycisphaerales bacterium]
MVQYPIALVIAAVVVPVLAWSAWRVQSRIGPGRAWASFAVRSLLIGMLSLALAQPLVSRGSDDVTVAVILDRSRSVSEPSLEQAVTWINEAAVAEPRTDTDRLALVHVARQAMPGAMPSPLSEVSLRTAPGPRDATDLRSAVELARAMVPQDTRNRLLLVSDGLSTTGPLSALARKDMPVDVLVLPVDRDRDVRVERIQAPSHARAGSTIEAGVVLHAPTAATGRLMVRRNGVPVQLHQGTASGEGIPVQLAAGMNVIPMHVQADGTMTRLDATWVPDVRTGDAVDNDSGIAVVLPAAVGEVLLVGERQSDMNVLADMLAGEGVTVRTASTAALSTGTAALATIDALVLVDVPRWALPPNVDLALANWVNHSGGGLLMTGGTRSLGAGGWIGSELESVLPVLLDPPVERQIQRGALVLIMHSCEMERGNYWGRRVCELAIEALTAQDLIGIVEYGWRDGGVSWALPLQEAGDRTAALRAAASLQYGDMPDFTPSFRAAFEALRDVDAGQRHVVVISDGDPQPPPLEVLNGMADLGIAVTTVQVGGHGRAADRKRMENLAMVTGGEFHRLENAEDLPQIIIEASQLASRSMVQQGTFDVVQTGTAAGPVADCTVPPTVHRYVLTAPREGVASVPWALQQANSADPLVAWWQRGSGRAAVVTVAPGDQWTPQWTQWPDRARFWADLVRWLRPNPDDGTWVLQSRTGDGGKVDVTLEATTEEAGGRLPAARAAVLAPDGSMRHVELHAAGPGRATGRYVMDQPGEWLVIAAVDDTHGEAPTTVSAASAMAWPDEDRAVAADVRAMERLAEATGGRVHRLDDDPAMAALFSRDGLTAMSAPGPIWPWLVIAAAILLPIDVAVRRLVLSREAQAGPMVQKTPSTSAPKRRAAPASAPVQDATPAPITPPEDASDDDTDDDAMARLREARRRGRGEEEDL